MSSVTAHSDGHGSHGDHAAQFKDRFWWSLVLAVPVVAFSRMFARLLGYDLPAGTAWVAPVFGTIVFIYGGWPFLSGAIAEIRARQPGMMLLVGLAISVAFVASLATSLHIGGANLDFWWELALLVVIERRNFIRAAAYSLGIVLITYVTFEYVLKTPLNTGPFGF